MKVTFICVNYNNSEITKTYIENVNKIEGEHECRIIVVDNSSEIEEINKLEIFMSKIDNTILIKNPSNNGYFQGLNMGLRYVVENYCHGFSIVGNNDIEFEVNFLNILEKLKIEDNELVIAPDIVTSNCIHENPHVLAKMSDIKKLKYDLLFSHINIAKLIMKFRSIERKPKAFDPVRKHIYMGIGALYVLTPNFFQHFDQLWAKVFLYGEEAVFAGQIASVEGKILYEPLLKCYHNESSATSKISFSKKYEIIRNSYKIYRKYL